MVSIGPLSESIAMLRSLQLWNLNMGKGAQSRTSERDKSWVSLGQVYEHAERGQELKITREPHKNARLGRSSLIETYALIEQGLWIRLKATINFATEEDGCCEGGCFVTSKGFLQGKRNIEYRFPEVYRWNFWFETSVQHGWLLGQNSQPLYGVGTSNPTLARCCVLVAGCCFLWSEAANVLR